jgi:hypothetical protein
VPAVALMLCLMLVVPAAGAFATEAQLFTWRSRLVDFVVRTDDFSGTRTFIDVAPSGRSLIGYWYSPEDGLTHEPRLAEGPFPDGSFHIESVDPADTKISGFGTFAMDSQGRPSVTYIHGIYLGQGILKYAWRNAAGVWKHQVVDRRKAVTGTALTVDSHDRPVIAYTKLGDQLWLASRGPGGWTTTQVATTQAVAIDVAVDAADHPRIAYVAWNGSNYEARLASFDGTSWTHETAGYVSSQGIEFGIELLLDRNGNPKLVYPVLEPVRGIVFAHRTASGWRTELIAAGNLWNPYATFDGAGRVNIVYYEATDGALVYGKRLYGDWLLQVVRDSPSPHTRIGRESSITFDARDRPRLAYYVGKEFEGCTVHYAVGTPA